MKRFILFLIVLVLAVAASIYLVNEKGYLMLVMGDQLVKMPIWLAILGVIVLLLVLSLIFKILRSILGFPSRWGKRSTLKRKQKAILMLQENLHAMIVGDWQLIEKQSQKNGKLWQELGLSIESEMLQLKSYLVQSDHDLIEKAYQKNSNIFKANDIYGWLYAQSLIARQNYQGAEKILLEVAKRSSNKKAAYVALADLYTKAQDYVSLKSLLPQLEKNGLAQESYAHYVAVAYRGLLNSASKDSQLSFENLWESLPRKVKQNQTVADAYIKALYGLGEKQKVLRLLKKRMGHDWDAELFELYAEAINHKEKPEIEDLNLIEKWLERYSPKLTHFHKHLHAQVAIAVKSFETAEVILLEILSEKACARTHMLLSEVYMGQNMNTKAHDHEQKALAILKR
ncbi:hypothetical protein N8865_01325 [Francisellaceae bacterium]|nr:hypothetical protein [Francisellaceae bacterium]